MRTSMTANRAAIAILLATLAVARAAEPADDPRSFAALAAADAARFVAGLARFRKVQTAGSGLGPVFNATSCVGCHGSTAAGGSGDVSVTRFGRIGPLGFDPMAEHGGPVVQSQGITLDDCAVPGETVPTEATIVTRRDTPPLFGLGLLDAIPDALVLRRADPIDRNHDGISGRPNVVGLRVGRFGWKAQIVTLSDFAGAALLNENGITSPQFPTELDPAGGPVACDTVPDPEDDGSGVAALTDFMTLLAPLPTGRPTREVRLGRAAFHAAGCAACHVSSLRTGASPVPALDHQRVKMFSDLLLHDMGPELADGIEQGDASGSEFRTAPLWGAAHSAPYLHDRRAATLVVAIAAHGGEGESARNRFLGFPEHKRRALITYVASL